MSGDGQRSSRGAQARGAQARPPALLLEQLALGELDASAAARVRAELAAAGKDVDAELAALRASDAEILGDYPADRTLESIRRRAQNTEAEAKPAPLGWIPWVLGPSAMAAAAALVLWLGDGGAGTAESSQIAELVEEGPREQVRIKGGVGAHLVVDRKTGEGHERLISGDAVEAGELVQLSYVPAGAERGVIVSIDGGGVATLHFPAAPGDEPRLLAGDEVPLDHAYELDAAPDFERFFIVTREGDEDGEGGPLSAGEVLRAAESLAKDPARARTALLPLDGEGWQQEDLVLRKRGAPALNGEPRPDPAGGEG